MPTNFIWTVLHRYLELGSEIETGNKRDVEFLIPEKNRQKKISPKKMAEKKNDRKKKWIEKNRSKIFESKKCDFSILTENFDFSTKK